MAALVLGGCTSVKQTFPDHDADGVWNAMVVAAEQPHYGGWTLRDNDVMVDDAGRRIEIDRRIERTLHPPEAEPEAQKQRWRFTVRLVKTDPPTAKFIIRTLALPVNVRAEARRYFDAVENLLGGREIGPLPPE